MNLSSPARNRSLVVGCVADTRGPFVEQAARLLLSLRWFGGDAARLPFLLAVVGELDPGQRAFFERHNARIVRVERFSERHGPSNKLRFFEIEWLDQFSHVLLLDCDTLVVADPTPWIGGEGLAAKPADRPTVSADALSRYLEDLGLAMPKARFLHDIEGTTGPPYFNSGAIVLEVRRRPDLVDAWARYDRDLLERANQFGILPFHVDQASLTAALVSSGIPFRPLPSRMNLGVHKTLDWYGDELYETDPVIIHYHGLTTSAGDIAELPLPRAQARAAMFNQRLQAERQGLAPRPAGRGKDLPKVIVGSGWWSDPDNESEWRIGTDRIRSSAFFHLWHRQVLRCLRPRKIIVTDSAAPDRPRTSLYPTVEWVTLDRNYGHANDLRNGGTDTLWCGWTRSVLNGAVYALACDADWYVYVEQDCLVHGDRFLEHAVGENREDILLGARTEGGVGIDARPAASMHQNSLIIVRKDGLRRFIRGILDQQDSDGEVSPEVKLAKSCEPFGELAIPYGRSRPVDFSRSHFYVQHLDDEELDHVLETVNGELSDGGRSLFEL